MDADKARKITEDSLKSISIKDLVKIYEEIEQEYAKGNYELFYRGILSKEDAAELKSKGYKIKYSTGEFDDFGNYYSGYFSISWRKRKKFFVI